MILLNFSHPLTDEQLARVEALTDTSIDRVIDLLAHFDNGQPFDCGEVARQPEVPRGAGP